MLRLLILMIALSSFVALPSFADDEDGAEGIDYARRGLYAGGHVLLGSTRSDHPFGSDAELDWDTAGGIDLLVGWRESERLAYELQFDWLMSRDGIEYGNWAFGANMKYFFMEERWQPYFLSGVNGLVAKVKNGSGSHFDWGFRHGVGLDYYLSENIALSVQSTFMWGVGNLWKHYYLTGGLGLTYRF
jgi:hypothetical protein